MQENYCMEGVLVDGQIVEAVRQGRLRIVDPGDRPLIEKNGKRASDAQLDTHGYILRIRKIYSSQAPQSQRGADGWVNLKETTRYVLHPGEFAIVETYEKIALDLDICGTVHALARLTLQGLSHISTTVHPGWGEPDPQPLRIAIKNVGNTRITLRDKNPIARVLFHQCGQRASLIRPPDKDEVFERMEQAILDQQRGKNKMRKILYGVYLTTLVLTVMLLFPILMGQPDLMDWIKAIGLALISAWVMYLTKQAGL